MSETKPIPAVGTLESQGAGHWVIDLGECGKATLEHLLGTEIPKLDGRQVLVSLELYPAAPNTVSPEAPAPASPVIAGPGKYTERRGNICEVIAADPNNHHGVWLGFDSAGKPAAWNSAGQRVDRTGDVEGELTAWFVTGPYVEPPKPLTLLEAAEAFVKAWGTNSHTLALDPDFIALESAVKLAQVNAAGK